MINKNELIGKIFKLDPDSEEFQFFLIWLVEEKHFDAKELIDVMYYSHKYQKLKSEYIKAKEKEK
jgi:hypothetical protein